VNHFPSRGRTVRFTAAVAGFGALSLLSACGGTTKSADSASAPSSASGSSSATSSAAGGSGNKNIVFSPLALKIPAMKGLSEGVKGYGASKGYVVDVQDPNLDPQKQATELQQVIESGKAGGVWVIAVQPDALKQVVQTAMSKKVPMVLNGVPEDYGLSGLQPGITFDTIDYKAQGKAIGEELGNCINEKLGGKAQVLWGESSAGSAGKADLEGSAREALMATAPGAEITATVTVTDRAATQTAIGNALQGHPDIKAVMGQNDEGTLGALGAFAAAGKELTCVTEGGGNDEALAKVKSGAIYAIVALQFQQDMAQSFDTLTAMMADPTAMGKQLTVPQQVVKAGS
jgi:ABC-type sugar transport system substrate-binding protein